MELEATQELKTMEDAFHQTPSRQKNPELEPEPDLPQIIRNLER